MQLITDGSMNFICTICVNVKYKPSTYYVYFKMVKQKRFHKEKQISDSKWALQSSTLPPLLLFLCPCLLQDLYLENKNEWPNTILGNLSDYLEFNIFINVSSKPKHHSNVEYDLKISYLHTTNVSCLINI